MLAVPGGLLLCSLAVYSMHFGESDQYPACIGTDVRVSATAQCTYLAQHAIQPSMGGAHAQRKSDESSHPQFTVRFRFRQALCTILACSRPVNIRLSVLEGSSIP